MTKIYALVHPLTRECRYVGKTVRTMNCRLRQHVRQAVREPGKRKVTSWVASLISKGLLPEAIVIDEVGDDWADQEKFWIAYLRFAGANLVNISEGGGGENRFKQKRKAKRKSSERAKKYFADPANRLAAAEYAKAGWKNPEFLQRRAEILARMKADDGFKEKQRAIKIAKWQDPEYAKKVHAARAKADLSGGARRMWARPEYQEAQRLARERRYGVKKS